MMQTRNLMIPSQMSDDALAGQVAHGDSAALESLYDRHAPAVLGLLLKVIGDRALAEDALQETFWRVWKNAGAYESQRGTFKGWLFRIARNLAIDSYRRTNARPQMLPAMEEADSVLDQIADPETDVAEQVQFNIQSRQVRNAIVSLPRQQRQVIEMAYFYGMTRQEIAKATGEALGTIHTRARLGLQKLREELEREEFEG